MPFGATVARGRRTLRDLGTPAHSAAVEVDGRRLPMERAADGFFYCFDPDAAPGSRYAFRFDTTDLAIPGPGLALQSRRRSRASEVVDADAFEWPDDDWRGRPWTDAVIYELHVGTFTPAGTYRGGRRAARLPGRRSASRRSS